MLSGETMSKILKENIIQDIVKNNPQALHVLAKYRIDICHGNQLSIEEGASKVGVEINTVLQELNTDTENKSTTQTKEEHVTKPEQEEVKCYMCGNTDREVAVLQIKFRGKDEWLCARCLPYWIHSG